jgi:hypothetical protein
VAELERGAVAFGQQREEVRQARHVLLQERRCLEQHGAAVLAQRLQHAVEVLHGVCGGVGLQPCVVRDAARRLDREAERRRHRLHPLLQHRGLGHLVEGVVDLHRRQPLGIERQHRVRRDLLGIEAALPLLEGIAAGARPQLHGSCS